MDAEEALEAQAIAAEEKKKHNKDKSDHAEYFLENVFTNKENCKMFDPKKKFGTIDGENTIMYENVTTAYPANLPVDMYQDYIMKTLPKKEKGEPWFIRPHHVENLTNHPKSLKDDVFNTHYFSHIKNPKAPDAKVEEESQ
jgi:hypothetical protein